MKAGIVGAGSMGSIFSYIFYKSGLDFALYEIKEDIVADIQNNGLQITDLSTETVIDVDISSNPKILTECDFIFLLVKSYSTIDAISSIKPFIKNDSIIISLQNGIGNFEQISNFIESNRIVYGTTTIGASKKNNHHVTAGGYGYIKIGSSSNFALNKVVSFLEKTNIELIVTDNPSLAIWEKAIINAGINPLASILNIKNGEILSNQFALKLQELIVNEACATAIAIGLDLNYNLMLSNVREVCKKTAPNTCSMLQDIQNKRKTEIDSINGFIVETAKKNGISTPVNETIYCLIKALENS